MAFIVTRALAEQMRELKDQGFSDLHIAQRFDCAKGTVWMTLRKLAAGHTFERPETPQTIYVGDHHAHLKAIGEANQGRGFPVWRPQLLQRFYAREWAPQNLREFWRAG